MVWPLWRGRAFALVEAAYLGHAHSGGELLRPLRELGPELDTLAAIRPSLLAQLNMGPEQPMSAVGGGTQPKIDAQVRHVRRRLPDTRTEARYAQRRATLKDELT